MARDHGEQNGDDNDDEELFEAILDTALSVSPDSQNSFAHLVAPDFVSAPPPSVNSDNYVQFSESVFSMLSEAETVLRPRVDTVSDLPRAKMLYFQPPLAISCIDIAVPPDFVFKALFNPLMRYTANPSLQACAT